MNCFVQRLQWTGLNHSLPAHLYLCSSLPVCCKSGPVYKIIRISTGTHVMNLVSQPWSLSRPPCFCGEVTFPGNPFLSVNPQACCGNEISRVKTNDYGLSRVSAIFDWAPSKPHSNLECHFLVFQKQGTLVFFRIYSVPLFSLLPSVSVCVFNYSFLSAA